MNDLEEFNFEGNNVRTVQIENEPYFVGKDVADILGYQNGSRDINRHVEEEDRQNYQNGTFESPRGLTVINESGLYSLILGSKLPNAKKFKRWVTHEVLPTIRQTGAYVTAKTAENWLNNPDMMIAALERYKEARTKIQQLHDENQQLKPKALFADAVATSHTAILVGDLAKVLRGNGVDIGANRLFEWMREKDYLISGKRTDRNMPTQKSMELGLFKVKETVINHSDGHTSISKTPKVTGKGQTYFINKFLQVS